MEATADEQPSKLAQTVSERRAVVNQYADPQPRATANERRTVAEHPTGARTTDGPVGDNFAEAVAMLARLPLSDAERAEAVRRLLAGKEPTEHICPNGK